MPFRSGAAFLGAENVVLCSDFAELNAPRLSLFLSELGGEVAAARVLDGPALLSKAEGFNVLFVVSGTEALEGTKECALATAPYGKAIAAEMNDTVQRLLSGFEHPNPTINAALGPTDWLSSYYYHESENWITVVVVMRTPSAHQIDHTMIRLFDQPEDICVHNLACLSR
ncbi:MULTISPECIES: hypothetical protein [Roseobacteraceae]|nr:MULTISPECIES: hypothetical protein [Roseobacteraceae]